MKKLLSLALMLVSCHIYGQEATTENYSLKGLADYLSSKTDVELEEFDGGLAIFDYKIDGIKKQDIITTMGKVLSSNGRYIVSEDLFMVPTDNGRGVVLKDVRGEILTKTIYDDIYDNPRSPVFTEGFLKVCKNGKYGYIDKSGNEVIPCKYSQVDNFKDGIAKVWGDVVKEFGYGFIGYVNNKGKEIVPCIIKKIGDYYRNGYVTYINNNGKYGVVDKLGKVVIPFEYDYICDFKEGLAGVIKDGKLGFVDNSNKVIIPFNYNLESYEIGEHNFGFSEGLAAVEKDGRYGYIDKSNNVVIPFIYSYEIDGFHGGIACVDIGCIDSTGTIVQPYLGEHLINGIYMCSYDDKEILFNKAGIIGKFSNIYYSPGNYLITVKKDNKYGAFNLTGKVLAPCIYTSLTCHDDLFTVKDDNGRYGAFDYTGKVLLPCTYTSLVYYQNVLRAIDDNGKYLYFNRTGKMIISSDDDVDQISCSEEILKVSKNDLYGYVDYNGKIVSPCIYEEAEDYHDGFAIVCKDEKWGVIDRNGKETIPCMYDRVSYFNNGLAAVDKEGKIGFVDTKGNSTFDYQK